MGLKLFDFFKINLRFRRINKTLQAQRFKHKANYL